MDSNKIALIDTGGGLPNTEAVGAAWPEATVMTDSMPKLSLPDGSVGRVLAILANDVRPEQLSELLRPLAVGGELALYGSPALQAAAQALPETEQMAATTWPSTPELTPGLLLRRTGKQHGGSRGCIICGHENSTGLGWKYWQSGDRAWASGIVPVNLAGFSNVVHGGIVAAMLDDALWYAINAATGEVTFTAELTTRYRRPAPIGQVLTAAARFTGRQRTILLAEGCLWGPDGEVLATASGRFMSGGQELADRLARS